MSTAPDRLRPRVSRGFHRLAVVVAAITLLVGIALSTLEAFTDAKVVQGEQAELVCAQKRLDPAAKDWGAIIDAAGDEQHIDLKKLGCSERNLTASSQEISDAREPTYSSYRARFLRDLSLGLAITFALTWAVYALVRAIGWVIGGFAN